MFLYNVTTKPNVDIAPEWLQWIQEVHIPELLQTGLFTEARLCRLQEEEESLDGPTYAVQYLFESKARYDTYIRDWAPQMRAKTDARFRGQFVAFRSVLEVIQIHKAAAAQGS